MFLDALLLVSDAQAFTGAATVSTNTIDLSLTAPIRAIGTGEPMGFGFSVDVAAGSGSTVKLEVIQSDTADLGTPDVIATLAVLAAVAVAGARFFLAIPPGYPTKRYIGIRETSTSGTTTITLTAWLTTQSLFSVEPAVYPKNYAV